MDTGLRNLLHDVAQEMPIDVEGGRRRTLRRARTRRAVGVAGAALVAVAFVAVSVSALRLVGDPHVPANTGPNPGPPAFAGLWPETDPAALAETQAALDDGHMPLRTTPDGTASLLATNLLSWAFEDVRIESMAVDGDEAAVVIRNRTFSDAVPAITVDLSQLGQTGPNGAWSVVGVSSPLLDEHELVTLEDASIVMRGTIANPQLVSAVRGVVWSGPDDRPWPTATSSVEGTEFELWWPAGVFQPLRPSVLWVHLEDSDGVTIGAFAMAVPTEGASNSPAPATNPDFTSLPPDVAVTAQRIYDAARAGDVDALAELVDPNIFIHELGDASDPIPSWRADPSVLELMVTILEMPPTSREIEGMGTFYFWPYLVNSDFTSLSDQERADLAVLGYTDEDIRMVADSGLGYQGPRLAIDEQGVWRNFLTTGE